MFERLASGLKFAGRGLAVRLPLAAFEASSLLLSSGGLDSRRPSASHFLANCAKLFSSVGLALVFLFLIYLAAFSAASLTLFSAASLARLAASSAANVSARHGHFYHNSFFICFCKLTVSDSARKSYRRSYQAREYRIDVFFPNRRNLGNYKLRE